MPWIIAVSVFIIVTLTGLIIFSWKNIKAVTKPRCIGTEKEISLIRDRGLWLDYDSYFKKDYEIIGKDGYVFHATFVDTPGIRNNGKYVIILHGHTSCRYGSVKYVNSYIKLGFSCIIYDARTHGDNLPSVCTLGNIESEDLMNVINDTRQRYDDIKVLGLHGESMGSTTALSSIRFSPKIDFIVADCGFIGCYEVLYDCYSNIHMSFLCPFIRAAGRILYHIDIKDSNALKALEKNYVPVLFIHGAGDTFIKPFHSKELKKKASEGGAYTELILVEGAGHAKCRSVAGFEKYTEYIRNFLSRINIL